MKPIELIKRRGESEIIYELDDTIINGVPVKTKRAIPFICGNCNTMKTCPKMQFNGGSRIGGWSSACNDFDVKKEVFGE